MHIMIKPAIFIFLLLFSSSILSSEIDNILALKNQPSGVIFEVISGDEKALQKMIPALQKDIEKLRLKFPKLPIAVISHGREQFSLLSNNKAKHKITHTLVQQLVENNIDVHVCGTHASWYSFEEEDFPDYLDVAPAAPAQINDYIELGYIHIEL